MRIYIIVASGDNDDVHERALKAGIEEMQRHGGTRIESAWIERGPRPEPKVTRFVK